MFLWSVDVSKIAWARRFTLGLDDMTEHNITDVLPLRSPARLKVSQHRSNHQDLIALRTEQCMHTLVTGWAQVNRRTSSDSLEGHAGYGLPTAQVSVV